MLYLWGFPRNGWKSKPGTFNSAHRRLAKARRELAAASDEAWPEAFDRLVERELEMHHLK